MSHNQGRRNERDAFSKQPPRNPHHVYRQKHSLGHNRAVPYVSEQATVPEKSIEPQAKPTDLPPANSAAAQPSNPPANPVDTTALPTNPERSHPSGGRRMASSAPKSAKPEKAGKSAPSVQSPKSSQPSQPLPKKSSKASTLPKSSESQRAAKNEAAVAPKPSNAQETTAEQPVKPAKPAKESR
ncbi:uncharacterized protein [Blastocystis hominis]|uniref:Uncharacterized protein n=1 Tax=Blastocystis hominis TaxID=12968 RepID=D8LWJ7_BLAHO|nr:uncharacterized protein [Blastocystis hominis]CBK20186.2 unnamed protein product [Blastocystis hominis]|eukprot:XP_012894234.1 uncharacterized protein [Blastocystis hominis]